MAAPVIRCKGVDLVDDHGADAAEQLRSGHPRADQHRLERFGGDGEDVGGLSDVPLARRRAHVPVPLERPSADQPGETLESCLLVVQQGADRCDVQHRRGGLIVLVHLRQQWEERRLGLAPGGGRQHHAVGAVEDDIDGLTLDRPQVRPAQVVDDLVLQGRTEAVEGVHHVSMSRSMASARAAPLAAARSSSDSSSADTTSSKSRVGSNSGNMSTRSSSPATSLRK